MSLTTEHTIDGAWTDNRINNLPCASAAAPYDAAGNQLCSTDANGAVSQYSYNADSQIGQIALLDYASSPFVTYTYDPSGDRILKSNASGTYTEYVYAGGQPLAELNSDGTWNDYIYANGQKIAKVASSDTRIHTSGVFTTDGNELRWDLPTPANADGSPYTAQTGDMLCFRQYQGPGAVGGPAIYFSNGLNSAWNWQDTSGNTMNQLFHQGAWYQRCADMTLGGRTAGTQIGWLALVTDVATGPGTWDIWYADMSITRADGSVIPIITAQPPTPVYGDFQGGGWTGTPQAVVETVPAAGDPTGANAAQTAHYYLDDHLGTAQMELSAGGWPVWEGQFAPFGAELDTQNTAMHYKFTGKERDAESELDDFGARYYGSNMGRFMTPDPSGLTLASLSDPQSFNLYAYARNNPLINTDPTGLDCVYANDNNDGVESIDHNSNSGECGDNGGTWRDGWVGSGQVSFGSNGNVNIAPVGRACVQAALRGMIAQTEGTDNLPDGGYGSFAGGGTISSAPAYLSGLIGGNSSADWIANPEALSGHPNVMVQLPRKSGPPIPTSAFGRYQIMSRTAKGYGFTDFSPAGQDAAANTLMGVRNMVNPAMQGDLSTAIGNGSNEWASLPGNNYGQGGKSMAAAQAAYNQSMSSAPECQ